MLDQYDNPQATQPYLLVPFTLYGATPMHQLIQTWSNNGFHVLLNNVHAPQQGIDTRYHIA
eukprot:2077663-Prorocentrum_lima.AAC.1